MRCTWHLIVIYCCCSLPVILCQARYDAAYVYGMTGKEVVLRCTKLISDSGIFRNDGGFARRLAYVQSRDGNNLTSGDYGGIWKVTQKQFERTVDFKTCRSSQFYEEIYEKFAINWTQVKMEELQIPLYSAIASKLFVEIACIRMRIPRSVSEQFEFWKINYEVENEAPNTEEEFKKLINHMPYDCSVRVRDVIIAVDASWKTSLVSMLRLKEFLFNMVEKWRIGETRVGIVQFAQSTYLNLRLDVGISVDKVRSAISRFQMHHENMSDVRSAINFTLGKFLPKYGGRRNGRSKVLLLITEHPQGSSHEFFQMARNQSVELITVVVGNSKIVDNRQVAAERKIFTSVSFERLEEIGNSVEKAVCEGRVYITHFGVIDDQLVGGESVLYEIVITRRYHLQILSNSSNICGYISYNHSDTPNSAYYDIKLDPGPVILPQKPHLGIRIENGGDFPAQFSFIVIENYVNITLPAPAPKQRSIRRPLMVVAIIVTTFLLLLITSLMTSRYCCEGKVAEGAPQPENEEESGAGKNALDGIDRIQTKQQKEGDSMTELFNPNHLTIVTKVSEIEERTKQIPQIETTGTASLYAVDQHVVANESFIKNTNQSTTPIDFVVQENQQLTEDRWMDVTKYESNLQQSCKEGKSEWKGNGKQLQPHVHLPVSGNLGVQVEMAEKYLDETVILKEARANLATAVRNRDIEITKKRRKEFQEISKLDEDEVDKFVEVLQLRFDLQQSIELNDLPNVEVLIEMTKEKGLEEELKEELDVVMSYRHHELQNKTTKKIRKELMKMNQTRVSEIRSYLAPPSGVQELMTAVLVLLGYNENSLNDWTKIQGIMGKTGKSSITRQIYKCDPRAIDYERVMDAKRILQQFNMETVQELSSGLAMFYVFAQTVIKSVESVPGRTSSNVNSGNLVE